MCAFLEVCGDSTFRQNLILSFAFSCGPDEERIDHGQINTPSHPESLTD